MPLFRKPFSPKKTPPRSYASLYNLHTMDRSIREVELGLEYGAPAINIAGQSLKFEDKQWIVESGGSSSSKEVQRLKKKNLQLEEQIYFLKLNIEALTDMVSESMTESYLLHKELDDLKSGLRKKK